jgi:hypothetical protein
MNPAALFLGLVLTAAVNGGAGTAITEYPDSVVAEITGTPSQDRDTDLPEAPRPTGQDLAGLNEATLSYQISQLSAEREYLKRQTAGDSPESQSESQQRMKQIGEELTRLRGELVSRRRDP